MKESIALLWSGGKDSSLALQALQEDERYQVQILLTTVTSGHDRISMHGVRRRLLEAQVASVDLELDVVEIPQACSNDQYLSTMNEALGRLRQRGITAVAAGDIHLEDVREYRESLLRGAGLDAVFPLWGQDTTALAWRFLELGFEAVTTCVDTSALDSRFAGRTFDPEFLNELPKSVDPCGENGEFHTFVYDGPIFAERVSIRRGIKIVRDERFCFCDLQPAAGALA